MAWEADKVCICKLNAWTLCTIINNSLKTSCNTGVSYSTMNVTDEIAAALEEDE